MVQKSWDGVWMIMNFPLGFWDGLDGTGMHHMELVLENLGLDGALRRPWLLVLALGLLSLLTY